MSWLSDAFHGVESFASEAVHDVGSFWTHNASWLTPLAIGAGALAGGALLGPALFGAEGAFAAAEGAEAGAELGAFGAGEGAGAFGAGAEIEGAAGLSEAEAAAEAGAAGAGGAVAPGAVDISITPFVQGAAQGGGFGSDVLAGGGPLDILGGTTSTEQLAAAVPGITNPAAIDPGFVALAEEEGPEEALIAGTGTTAENLASTAPVAVGEGGGGLQGGVDVAAAQAEDLGAGSTGAQVAAGEPLGSYPTETAGQAFAAGRFPANAMTADLSVAQQDALTGGLLGQGPLPPTDQAIAAAGDLPAPTTIGEAPITAAPIGEGSPITTAGGPVSSGDVGASSIQAANAGPSGPANLFDKTTAAISGAGKGLGGFLDNPLVKYGLPLGVMGGLMLKGPDKLPPQSSADLALANTTASFGATELTLAQNGQVSAADAASLNIQRQNARNQAYQTFASRGGGDPTNNTDYQQTLQQIDAQIEAQKQTILNNMITNGLNAIGGASKSLQTAAALQVQNDASFNQSLTGALQSFGMIAAFSGARGGNRASSSTDTSTG